MYDWQLEKVLRSDPYTSKLCRGEREGDIFDSYGHPPGSLDSKFKKWMTSVVRKMANYSRTREEYKDLGHLHVGTIAFISCYFEPEEFPVKISSKV